MRGNNRACHAEERGRQGERRENASECLARRHEVNDFTTRGQRLIDRLPTDGSLAAIVCGGDALRITRIAHVGFTRFRPPLGPVLRPGVPRGSSLAEFDGLNLRDLRVFNSESEDGSHHMPTMMTAGTRVHVQQACGGIAHYSEDMRMARYEERWLGGSDFLPGVQRVMTRVAAHVCHEDLHTEAVPVKIVTHLAADFLAVDIAVHGAERLESLKPAEDTGSEVTSVPDFVTFREVFEDCVVEKAVRVGHEANAHASGMIA